MDPLSDVLSLLKPRSSMSGGFHLNGHMAVQFPHYQGIKCYAIVTGQCWLSLEGMAKPLLLTAGDCFLLPRGLPFSLATDPSIPPIDYRVFLSQHARNTEPAHAEAERYIVGGYFQLDGGHAEVLLKSLPPIIHIKKEQDKAAMRWSLERMKEELHDPQPGGSLIAQQLACMMLVQALRLHVAEGASGGVGWLFALADKQMNAAITAMHSDPGRAWTLQALAERAGMSRSVFALRFKATVGSTPMEYLTNWRMLLAGDKLKNSDDCISDIAMSLGYESESAFGKAFKRAMGCAPRQYSRGCKPEPSSDRTDHATQVAELQNVAGD